MTFPESEDENESENESHRINKSINASVDIYRTSEWPDGDEDDSIACAILIDAQDSSGLFKPPVPFSRTMQEHFCAGTLAQLHKAFAQYSTALDLSADMCSSVADTLMTMQYFETHLAKDKDLWEMMTEKAEYAVQEALQLLVEEADGVFAALKQMVDGACEHKHFLGVREDPAGTLTDPFPSSDRAEACPSCGARSQMDVISSDENQPADPTVCYCLFAECDVSETSWDC